MAGSGKVVQLAKSLPRNNKELISILSTTEKIQAQNFILVISV